MGRPKMRVPDAAGMADEERRWRCESCSKFIEDDTPPHCQSCRSYYEDVSRGIFDDWD